MAGIVVNVYLTDLFDCTKVGDTPAQILARVTSHYTDAFAFANKGKKDDDKHKFTVGWATTKPTPKDTDFVIHFLPWDFWSLARFMLNNKKKEPIVLADEWGLTAFRETENPPLVCSEVYVKNLVANDLGDLAFHEMLHGKLVKGNSMHSMKGIGDAKIGAAMNDANRQAVADTIARPRRMWPDAWGLAESAATAKKQGDPLWNI